MRLKDKVAIVTGASSGIGSAIALAFAQEGAKVTVNYNRSREGAEKVHKAIGAMGGTSLVVKADVSKVQQIEMLVAETVSRLGGLDIMVNNAGMDLVEPITTVEEDDFDRVIAVNLKGMYFGSKAAIVHMLDHGGGCIINISSLAAVCGTTGLSAYSAAKGGIVGFSKSLAIEYALQNIRVNVICPGYIRTGMTAEFLEGVAEFVVNSTPMGRIGIPEEVAPTAVFLASDDSRFITGQALVVDGGFSVV
jgi:3-oxoacyl-[acyl-carrier protein] reductase